MTRYLQTFSGLIAEHSIVRIGALETHGPQQWHPIDYKCGSEPRETRASAEAVEEYFDEDQQ